jgi:hypothetical protein
MDEELILLQYTVFSSVYVRTLGLKLTLDMINFNSPPEPKFIVILWKLKPATAWG